MHHYTSTLQWINQQKNAMLATVEKWAALNSGSENLTGLAAFLTVLRGEFSILGGEEQVISLNSRQVIGQRGFQVDVPLGQALSIRKRPAAPLQIFLAGHMDTVYGANNHFQHTERLDETTLRGPGVTDMKGGLLILLKTLQALELSPYKESIGWEVLINPDEEIGSPGSTPLFVKAAKRHHIGLIFEPGFADGAFVSKRKGSSNLTIIAHGRSAHAGRDFHAGRNSIYALVHIIQEIEQLTDESKGITLNVGHIEGGGPVNIVPDLAICRLNIRTEKSGDLTHTKAKIQGIVNAAASDGIELKLVEDYSRMPKPYDTRHKKIFKDYKSCAEDLDLHFQLRETGGVCDGNTLAAEGLPTLDSVGAVGGFIHTDEEYLLIPSLVERTKLNTLFLLKLASGEIKTDRIQHG